MAPPMIIVWPFSINAFITPILSENLLRRLDHENWSGRIRSSVAQMLHVLFLSIKKPMADSTSNFVTHPTVDRRPGAPRQRHSLT